ncbi:glycoside hydrolase family 88/105 protein [Proteiniphilum sp. UBA5384]|uniref:glycoside hydrolase family 88/105 protein n=1 Tax=Proteiniphilum sp. UBA5384 TaxID=1947279 RepID=UPI0039C9CD2E
MRDCISTYQIKKIPVLLVIVFCAFFQVMCAKKNELKDFPHGYTPQEIGLLLSERFVPSEHFLHRKQWIHYPEVCAHLGALRFAGNINNELLIYKLQNRFEPLFSSEVDKLPPKNHVDMNMFGSLPLELYKITHDQRYYDLGMTYADSQWEVPEEASKEEKNWADKGYSWQTRLWIDDMYMITIVQSQAYLVTGDRKYIDRTARQMVLYLDELQMPNGLFYHAPDVPFYWGRGNGWMAAGMAELLGVLPAVNPDRARIMEGYVTMMRSLKKFQGEDGMWKQLVDDPECWSETSGSAMFTYAMIVGVNNGWLDASYVPVVKNAWMALVSYINEEGDMTEICVGTNKKNDRQYYYDRPRMIGDFHGQAPMLWCAAELISD